MRIALAVTCIALVAGTSAAAQEGARIAFSGGRVTIVATDMLATDVLAVWARQGRVRVTGAELLGTRRVTLALEDVDEKQALQEIVGDGAAFVAQWRLVASPSGSRFAQITVADPRRLAHAAPPDRSMEPEARFSYYQSEKQMGPSLGQTSSPEPTGEIPVPEARFDYWIPAKAAGPKLVPGEPRVDAVVPEPEKRYEYFVPGKIKK